MLKKNKSFLYYVIDLNWLVSEVQETYSWRLIPFRTLVDLLLFNPEEVYLERLHYVNRLYTAHLGPITPEAQESLSDFWMERRLNLLYRLERLLDIHEIEESVILHNWLPGNHVILKKVEPCYKPPPDHLVSNCLF